MAWIWTIVVIVTMAAMVLAPLWAVAPALRATWLSILNPPAGEQMRRGGLSTLRRALVAVVVFGVANLLLHYIFRESLTRIDVVNYVMLGSIAGVVAVVLAIADYRARGRGGRT
ncbi:MAG TPA: hypothetical protein VOB72_20830 [Candidatus Dormibacteraeota bacterium]|nr:hypothetical protein [Candidatus Dormibacteraeota bacterium]